MAGNRPWPFDAGPFPIPMVFRDACADRWERFLDDVSNAYTIVQQRREQLCAVAQALATPLAGPLEAPTAQSIGFTTFIANTLDAAFAIIKPNAAEQSWPRGQRCASGDPQRGHLSAHAPQRRRASSRSHRVRGLRLAKMAIMDDKQSARPRPRARLPFRASPLSAPQRSFR